LYGSIDLTPLFICAAYFRRYGHSWDEPASSESLIQGLGFEAEYASGELVLTHPLKR
jgi:hypothetical protein